MKLKKIQEEFTHSCRGRGLNHPKEIKNIEIYQGFLFEKVQESLESAYPITLGKLPGDIWKEAISRFIGEFDCKTPYFWRIPEQFCLFAHDQKFSEHYKIPYLEDLLDFEWAEIEVFMMKDGLRPELSKEGNVLEDLLFMNPDHLFQKYDYTVFQKDSTQKKECHVITYRHFVTKEVHYLQLSRFYRVVLELLREHHLSGMETLQFVAPMFQREVDANMVSHANQFFQDLFELGVIEGYLK